MSLSQLADMTFVPSGENVTYEGTDVTFAAGHRSV
jgi:hypothetical protein